MLSEHSIITAFKHATTDLFGAMLGTSVAFDEPAAGSHSCSNGEVSGIISFTGTVTGTMTVYFPRSASISVVNRFTGMDVPPHGPDFVDAIGELANMIAGSAKAKFGVEDVAISSPSVVLGSDYRVLSGKDGAITVIGCRFDDEMFWISLALKCDSKRAA